MRSALLVAVFLQAAVILRVLDLTLALRAALVVLQTLVLYGSFTPPCPDCFWLLAMMISFLRVSPGRSAGLVRQ